jgi:hypothetical protein
MGVQGGGLYRRFEFFRDGLDSVNLTSNEITSCRNRYAPIVFGIIPECRSASLRN